MPKKGEENNGRKIAAHPKEAKHYTTERLRKEGFYEKNMRIFMACLIYGLLPGSLSYAYERHESVCVTIPNFSVTVNDVQYNSKYSEYPFLVYNDVTYVPMTYDLAAFMGINITFDKGTNEVYHKDEMILHV